MIDFISKLKVTKDEVVLQRGEDNKKSYELVRLTQLLTVVEFYKVHLQVASMTLLKKTEVPEPRKLLWT